LARAAIDEAHKHGLKTAAHIFYHDDAVALAEAGIDAFAHLVRDREMSDALIAPDAQEQGLCHAQPQCARTRHPQFAAGLGR
jgi:imidazolonepropionase-like amidohydrolase